jgi:hypothetical protein
MAKKESKPKVAPEQIAEASKSVKSQPAKEVPPEKAKATSDEGEKVEEKATPKQKGAGIPSYLKKRPQDFVVGTEEYSSVIAKHNELFGTQWNTHRVRPAVFYGIYQGVEKHYKGEK